MLCQIKSISVFQPGDVESSRADPFLSLPPLLSSFLIVTIVTIDPLNLSLFSFFRDLLSSPSLVGLLLFLLREIKTLNTCRFW